MDDPTRRAEVTPSLARDRAIHELLARALERPEGERRLFLERATEDEELRRRVLSLLTLPEGAALPRLPWDEDDPATIGPYEILRRLGEGGMGRVYLARQCEPVERVVALKVVHEALRSASALARFAGERQALARLSHPHVAQLFEAGTTDDGFPFFAMEWVDGSPITHYCDRAGLTIPERLRLFTSLCQGVEHAHQRQVLHRDLKPSNLLVAEVDGRPIAKIIDFGIAKGLDEPLVGGNPATGQHFVGTPVYMSPEALGLEPGGVDTRSDVFSLGIVLYELLVGVRPFEDTPSLAELLRRREDLEAERPSARLATLDRERRTELAASRKESAGTHPGRLSGDLDWIVMKAISRDREQRYGSAAALAEDLERCLRHQPVTARPPSTGYFLRRLMRRHRVAVAAALVAALALAGGLAGISLGLVRARRAEQEALAEAKAAQWARGEAEEVVKFLTGLFRDADPGAPSNRAMVPAAELTARELLDRGARRIAIELADRPLVRARVNATIGEVHSLLGLYAEATAELEEALALRQRHLPANHPDLAASHFLLARPLGAWGRFEPAEAHLREALRIYENLPEHLAEQGRTLFELGHLEASRGRYGESVSLLERAVELAELTTGADSMEVARPLNTLGVVHFSQGRLEQAEQAYRRALGITRELVPAGHPNLVQMRNNLAAVLASSGRLAEAAPLFEESLRDRRTLLGAEHPDVAESLNNLGVLRADLSELDEAERLHREALSIRRRVFGERHPLVAWSLDNLAVVLAKRKAYPEAEALQRQALEVRCQALGGDHPETARSLHQLGLVTEELGRDGEALRLFAQALAIRERRLDAGSSALKSTRERIEALRSRLGPDAGPGAAPAADPCAAVTPGRVGGGGSGQGSSSGSS